MSAASWNNYLVSVNYMHNRTCRHTQKQTHNNRCWLPAKRGVISMYFVTWDHNLHNSCVQDLCVWFQMKPRAYIISHFAPLFGATEEFIKTNANQCKTHLHAQTHSHSFNHLSIRNVSLPQHLLSSSPNEFSVLLMILLSQKDGVCVCVCAGVTYNLIKAHYHLMLPWYESAKEDFEWICMCAVEMLQVSVCMLRDFDKKISKLKPSVFY